MGTDLVCHKHYRLGSKKKRSSIISNLPSKWILEMEEKKAGKKINLTNIKYAVSRVSVEMVNPW